MTIEEGIKHSGRPFNIPDCSRDDLPEFFKKRGAEVGVEVGVFEANYTIKLAESGAHIYGVDPWVNYRDYTYGLGGRTPLRERRARKRVEGIENITLLKETSMEAVERFEEDSIDFVYIDGNHQFKYIAEDMYEWWKRLKPGGVMAGHDYAYFKQKNPKGGCQVHEMVDAWAKSYDMDFWVLGSFKAKEGEKRDRYRSWMFIK